MSKKVELGKGWIHRTTKEEIEILNINSFTKGHHKRCQLGCKYLTGKNKGDSFIIRLGEFKQMFRRKDDED